jgi:hypothetical protein
VRAHVFFGEDEWAGLRVKDGGVNPRASATQSVGHLRRADDGRTRRGEFLAGGRRGVPRLATRKVHRAFPWRNHQLCDVPENVPATTLVPAPRQLPGAKTTNENPSASCKLTEGLLEALELMRPLL